jgi:hypothetical protein
MNNQDQSFIAGATLLTATSWASKYQPMFSIAASCATVILVIFGVINYLKKWRNRDSKI